MSRYPWDDMIDAVFNVLGVDGLTHSSRWSLHDRFEVDAWIKKHRGNNPDALNGVHCECDGLYDRRDCLGVTDLPLTCMFCIARAKP